MLKSLFALGALLLPLTFGMQARSSESLLTRLVQQNSPDPGYYIDEYNAKSSSEPENCSAAAVLVEMCTRDLPNLKQAMDMSAGQQPPNWRKSLADDLKNAGPAKLRECLTQIERFAGFLKAEPHAHVILERVQEARSQLGSSMATQQD